MKTQTTKKLPAFIIMMMFSVFILVFYNSCQKEISFEANTKSIDLISKTSASSSIIYTDVKPDSTVYSENSNPSTKYYYLDLNNDGIEDFRFTISYNLTRSGYDSYVEISPESGSSNQVAKNNKGVLALDTSTVINSSLSKWSDHANQTLAGEVYQKSEGFYEHTNTGNWTFGTVKYLPLKLIKGANIYYGWARLSIYVLQESSLTVMDYAYNSNPNQSILAGQTK